MVDEKKELGKYESVEELMREYEKVMSGPVKNPWEQAGHIAFPQSHVVEMAKCPFCGAKVVYDEYEKGEERTCSHFINFQNFCGNPEGELRYRTFCIPLFWDPEHWDDPKKVEYGIPCDFEAWVIRPDDDVLTEIT